MIWRPILARSGPVLLLALIAVAAPNLPAPAQELTTEERLDRIERDLSMLQRQVYSQSAGAPEMGSEGAGAADLEVRMERLEQQMRDLTGRVEEMTNRVDRLRQRIEQINGDVAARFGPGAPAPPPPPGPRGPSRVLDTEGPPPAGTLAPPGTPPGMPPGMPPGTLPGTPGMAGMPPPGTDTLTPPAPVAPGAAGDGAPGQPNPPAGGALPSGPASAQYNFAFGLLKEANYPAAEEALREFVRQHPGSALAGDAQYWLGETYYARRQYHQAARAFAAGYRRYPKGSKAPEDLLKLGMSLARGGQHRDACLAFAQLDHAFPHPGGAVRSRATVEKKRLDCASLAAGR